MNILKGNPQSILNVLAKQNPQVSEVIKYVNNNGGNAKECFYKLAKEKGIDPNEILKMIK